MTDNACVSVYAGGPAAAAATRKKRGTGPDHQQQQQNGNADKEDSYAGGDDGVLLMAVTEDPFGTYLVDPKTLQTLEQVRTLSKGDIGGD